MNSGLRHTAGIDLLRSYTTLPLLSKHVAGLNNHGIRDVVRFMSIYGITRLDWDSLAELRNLAVKVLLLKTVFKYQHQPNLLSRVNVISLWIGFQQGMN